MQVEENCRNCRLLRELILNTKGGLPNYENKKHCCILFTIIGDRKNDYSDSVYEISNPETGLCECFTPIKENKNELS